MEDSGIDSDPKPTSQREDEQLFLGSDSSCGSNPSQIKQQRNTTKQLHKRLEARIQQAKLIQRNVDYIKLPKTDKSQGNTTGSNSTSSANLIPIQRLPIPQKSKEHHPLVEYWPSDSESEDEMTLYPFSKRNETSSRKKQDLTDTFSIEELSEGSEDSLNLGSVQSCHPQTHTYTPTGCFSCQCHIL